MNFQVIDNILQSQVTLLILLTIAIAALLFCAIQLLRYGPAINRLNRLEVLSQLHHLGETQKEMTYQFSAAVASSHSMRMASDELRRDLESLRDFITNAHAKLSSYNADEIAQLWLDEEIKPTSGSTIWHKAFSVPVAGKTPDQLLTSMKADWTRLLDALRARLEDANIPVELSRLGKLTYMLTDKRRPNPLPMETADLITALDSQHKRYVTLQRIARHEHDNFTLLINAGIRELQKIPSKMDNHASQNRTISSIGDEEQTRLQ